MGGGTVDQAVKGRPPRGSDVRWGHSRGGGERPGRAWGP